MTVLTLVSLDGPMKDLAAPGAAERSRRLAPSGDPMLAARFTVPAPPKLLVHRPGLLGRLTKGAQGTLTLVNGPAGAGKTTLVSHWLDARLAPPVSAWLTVEATDAPGVFWAHVLETLRRHGVRLGAEVGRPTSATAVDQSLLIRLADALAERSDPAVLVLDQVDVLTSKEIVDQLQFVLSHCSAGLHLVLLGRAEPPLPLHRYRAAGEITEIRSTDLRFTETEARELLAAHGLALPGGTVRLLVERTEGWAAGLRLCALAMQRSEDPKAFVQDFAADRTTIADFLLTEVLEPEPPPTQELLLRASITDPIHPDLADALGERQDADRTLAELARANAFVERVDGSAVYRLHPLFAEVLRARLRHRHPGLEPRLRGEAARWFAGAGWLTEAVAQAAAAADWEFAAGQVVDQLAIGRLLAGPDAEELRPAFAAMPPDLPGSAPALVGAACRLVERDLEGCRAQLRRADGCLGESEPAESRLSRALVEVLAGRLAGDPAVTEQAAADAERLWTEVPPSLAAGHPEVPAMVLAALGAAELGAGHLDRAAAVLATAVEACGRPATEPPLCDSLGSLALVELLRGRLRAAETHAGESLAVVEQAVVRPQGPVRLDHVVLAGVATEHDDLATARVELELARATAGPQPEPVAEVAAAVIGARLAAAEGQWEQAFAVLQGVGSGAAQQPLPAWAVDELAIAESAAHLTHGDADTALQVLGAVPSERPEHALAEARALLATGQQQQALRVLAAVPGDGPATGATTATAQTQACLLRAQAAVAEEQPEEARLQLTRALVLARPEELRRVFVESGPWVRRLLRQDPQLARAHSWLPARTLGYLRPGACEQLPAVVGQLSEREREVLRQTAQLLSTEEIAAELFLSVNTVKTHLRSVYRKLCVSRRSEAVRRARELGIL
ncbi:LuxR C-terminal-related transcriptional regulator [Kitasatospora azatica]|uniref:LuxR C-terminal-related transcriptional regulator n=1 Tax=Kitasatospora azatica TaxID=58347 RepID=UPI0018DE92F1|nr:LuxR C-terminal-related transcriptional regulator [Kitasatospora azatica]